jgi:hypothetical protein
MRQAAAEGPGGRLSAGEMMSTVGWTAPQALSGECITNASVPGTALVNLLRNGTFGDFGGGGDADVAGRVYVDQRLQEAPDVNTTGPGFYTFWFRTEVDLAAQPPDAPHEGGGGGLGAADARRGCFGAGDDLPGELFLGASALWLELRGANYRVDVFANGRRLTAMQPPPPAGGRAGGWVAHATPLLPRCEARADTDWYPSSWSLGTAAAPAPEDCCAACAATEGCVVGTHCAGVCYLKAAADVVGGSYTKANVTSCQPSKLNATDEGAKSSAGDGTPGMFLRRRFPISLLQGETTLALAILVTPPDHPGDVSNGGQGGDHSLAMDGATMQSAAGWDWVASIPDRNTGLWDRVAIGRGAVVPPTLSANGSTHPCASHIILADAAVFTVELPASGYDEPESEGARIKAVVSIIDLNPRRTPTPECTMEIRVSVQHATSRTDSTGATTPLVGTESKLIAETSFGKDISFDMFMSAEDLVLWWPHNFIADGADRHPHLYTATFELWSVSKLSYPSVVHSITQSFGVRVVESFYDENIQSRAFSVNGKPLYLEGGNWITSDAMLRFATSPERYHDEVSYDVSCK